MEMRLLRYVSSIYLRERSAVAISLDGRMSVVRGLDLWQKESRHFNRDLKLSVTRRNKISQTSLNV